MVYLSDIHSPLKARSPADLFGAPDARRLHILRRSGVFYSQITKEEAIRLPNYYQNCVEIPRNNQTQLLTKGYKACAFTQRPVNSQNGGVWGSEMLTLPVSYYQMLGLRDGASMDRIKKAYDDLKSSAIDEAYSITAVFSRQELLEDVKAKLMGINEHENHTNGCSKQFMSIPWAWLPGALALLQQVNEGDVVLKMGEAALLQAKAESYQYDILLAMALSKCSLARNCFEKGGIGKGFEALVQAHMILKRGKESFRTSKLIAEIEASLEEMAPACTLDHLSIPLTPENQELRAGALGALSELIHQGLAAEPSCSVRDWYMFLKQSMERLQAKEILELLPWESLLVIRNGNDPFKAQQQKDVLNMHTFYSVIIAYIAVGFKMRRPLLIETADRMARSLTVSDRADLRLERVVCAALLGQGDIAFNWLKENIGKNLTEASQDSVKDPCREAMQFINGCIPSIREQGDLPALCTYVENWLRDIALRPFADTHDCNPSLANYFNALDIKAYLLRHGRRSMAKAAQIRVQSLTEFHPIHQIDWALHVPPVSLGKKKAMDDNGCAPKWPERNASNHFNKTNNINGSSLPIRAPKSAQDHELSGIVCAQDGITDAWLGEKSAKKGVEPISNSRETLAATNNPAPRLNSNKKPTYVITNNQRGGNGVENKYKVSSVMTKAVAGAFITGSVTIAALQLQTSPAFRHHLDLITGGVCTCSLHHPVDGLVGNHKAPKENKERQNSRLMPTHEAEALIRRWQSIKADALGPEHSIHTLPEILGEPMLSKWQVLAEEAKARSCYWRFVLLNLSIIRAEIIVDEVGWESVQLEAIVEEAAELVEHKEARNPNYYSTYRARYQLERSADRTWRICRGETEPPTPSVA